MALATAITHNGVTFNCSARQAGVIEALMETNGGGFAVVRDYVSDSKRTKPEVADINFVSRFSTEKLYARRIKAINEVKFSEVIDSLAGNPKLKDKGVAELLEAFNARKQELIDSCQTTLDGDRSDGYRQGHDANYLTLVPGVKVHFVTEETTVAGKKLKRPVLDAKGNPTVASIMVAYLKVSKTVKTPGEYKVVNSGIPVLLGQEIEKRLPTSTKIKYLSLKDDKFSSLSIGKVELLPENFRGL